jgi:fucose permease
MATVLSAAALFGQALAPAYWVVIAAAVVLAIGSGAIDASLNAYAARQFNARRITWMHACYGLGAAVGPLVVAGSLGLGLSRRWAFDAVAVAQVPLAIAFWATAPSWRGAPRSEPRQVVHGGSTRRVWSGAPVFALQTGLESSTAPWAFLYLTDARGQAVDAAAGTVSAYWIALLVGRVVLGPVADRAHTGYSSRGSPAWAPAPFWWRFPGPCPSSGSCRSDWRRHRCFHCSP